MPELVNYLNPPRIPLIDKGFFKVKKGAPMLPNNIFPQQFLLFNNSILLYGNITRREGKLLSTGAVSIKLYSLSKLFGFLNAHQKFLPAIVDQTSLMGTTFKGVAVGAVCMVGYKLFSERKKEWSYVSIVDNASFLLDIAAAASGVVQIYLGYPVSGALTMGAFACQVLHSKKKIRTWQYLGICSAYYSLESLKGFQEKNNFGFYSGMFLAGFMLFGAATYKDDEKLD
ncbi:MAG: hypothetical protein JSR58_06655 [Verrucomicrobia bacterium]|nr:hypothetical protein [Verrucomicrobiota bacterium]